MIHVLVIEEGRRARERLLRALSDAGYGVSVARDGLTALEMVRQRCPDVIVHGRVTPRKSVTRWAGSASRFTRVM
jgi:DNA-binding response OmpR family regulator